MLTYIKGNLLEQPKGILVHGCNTTTSPAGGIAGLIFKKWPAAEKAHWYLINQLVSDDPRDALGLHSVYPVEGNQELVIINAITQLNPGSGSLSYDAIRECFKNISEYASFYKQHWVEDIPIIIPKIGAGIAGGDWDTIEAIIDESVSTEHEVVVYVL